MERPRASPLTPLIMCFPKPPELPKPVDTGADPELTRQRQAAELENAALKADNKQHRMEDQLAQLSGRMGRKSLFSGGQGGAGFPSRPRSFTGPGVAPNPTPPGGTGDPGTPRPRRSFRPTTVGGKLALFATTYRPR